MLEGKRILVTGVLTHRSIAYAVAERAQLAGAEVLLTSFGRARSMTERSARRLPRKADVLELDVNEEGDFERLSEELSSRWGAVDGAVHAIAHATPDALGGNFLATPKASAVRTFETSAYSFKALAHGLYDLYADGAALVALDFDASVAWPAYDWMGVAKAALEAICRYLARDLGPAAGVRVNLVSAGPLATPAAGAIPGFDHLAQAWTSQAPLGWDTGDALPVAEAVCFLLSDSARGISGEVLHVDGGFHAMGTHLNGVRSLEDAAAREGGS